MMVSKLSVIPAYVVEGCVFCRGYFGAGEREGPLSAKGRASAGRSWCSSM